MPYLDLHTHAWPGVNPEVIALHAFDQLEAPAFASHHAPCTVGFHPWHIRSDISANQWGWLEHAIVLPQVRAIGEIGLDALRGPEMAVQQAVFERQLHLANTVHKPVVIHCVRAFEPLQQSIRRVRPDVPLVLHGYRKSPELLLQLLAAGFQFSFGAALADQRSPARRALLLVPAYRRWLETDDSGWEIQKIYQLAASILTLDEKQIQEEIWHHAKNMGII